MYAKPLAQLFTASTPITALHSTFAPTLRSRALWTENTAWLGRAPLSAAMYVSSVSERIVIDVVLVDKCKREERVIMMAVYASH